MERSEEVSRPLGQGNVVLWKPAEQKHRRIWTNDWRNAISETCGISSRDSWKNLPINKDSILKENLGRTLKNKKSERGKLLEKWKIAKESLIHWLSETSFFEYQLHEKTLNECVAQCKQNALGNLTITNTKAPHEVYHIYQPSSWSKPYIPRLLMESTIYTKSPHGVYHIYQGSSWSRYRLLFIS